MKICSTIALNDDCVLSKSMQLCGMIARWLMSLIAVDKSKGYVIVFLNIIYFLLSKNIKFYW